MSKPIITWKAPEYEYRTKTSDWYWAVWIIVVALSVIAILFNDILLAILILVSAFTLMLLAKRPPNIIDYKITTTGIQVRKDFYPFENIESFGIEEVPNLPPKIIIKSRKVFMPIFTLPLKLADGSIVDPEEVREILKQYLKEEDQSEPLGQKLMEYLGF